MNEVRRSPGAQQVRGAGTRSTGAGIAAVWSCLHVEFRMKVSLCVEELRLWDLGGRN